MPCSPEMRKKADTVLDSIAMRIDSILSKRDGDKGIETGECAIAEDSSEREELRTGALSKKE